MACAISARPCDQTKAATWRCAWCKGREGLQLQFFSASCRAFGAVFEDLNFGFEEQCSQKGGVPVRVSQELLTLFDERQICKRKSPAALRVKTRCRGLAAAASTAATSITTTAITTTSTPPLLLLPLLVIRLMMPPMMAVVMVLASILAEGEILRSIAARVRRVQGELLPSVPVTQ